MRSKDPDARMTPVPHGLRLALIGGTLAVLLYFEHRRRLRKPVEPKLRHDTRNFTVAALAAAAVQLAEEPVIAPLARAVEERRWGLLKQRRLPAWLDVTLAVLLLDYTLYVWHILVHRVPFLWRFHQVHHVDLDLTATTALRFHAGEILLSVIWRAAQTAAIGAGPRALSIWQTATLLEIMFHHSNIALSPRLEQWLSRLIVTPRLHAIHHSVIEEERNSNWSSGLTVWDSLHGTLRQETRDEIEIGVSGYRDEEDVALRRILAMPFRECLALSSSMKGRRISLPTSLTTTVK